MTYLRFTPAEYQALAGIYRSLELARPRPHFVKRLLATSLADALPALAVRIARLSRSELKLLIDHLRQAPPPEHSHELTPDEVEVLVEVAGPLLWQSRFAHLLKRALVRRLIDCRPSLAAKVDRLSLRQFTTLCREVSGRPRGQ